MIPQVHMSQISTISLCRAGVFLFVQVFTHTPQQILHLQQLVRRPSHQDSSSTGIRFDGRSTIDIVQEQVSQGIRHLNGIKFLQGDDGDRSTDFAREFLKVTLGLSMFFLGSHEMNFT